MEALQFLAPFVKGNNVRAEEVYGSVSFRNDTEANSNSNQEFEHFDDNQSEASLSSDDLFFPERVPETRVEKYPEIPTKEAAKGEAKNKRKLSAWSSGDEEQRPAPKRSKYEEESRKMFLLSLLSDVQKLNDHKMRIFRKGVLDILDSLFVENENLSSAEQVSSEIILPKTEPSSQSF